MMFLIKTVYENAGTTLLKVEGEISTSALEAWAVALASPLRVAQRQVILECSGVRFVNHKVAQRLVAQITSRIFLLNCPPAIAKLMRVAGLSRQVLD